MVLPNEELIFNLVTFTRINVYAFVLRINFPICVIMMNYTKMLEYNMELLLVRAYCCIYEIAKGFQ